MYSQNIEWIPPLIRGLCALINLYIMQKLIYSCVCVCLMVEYLR